MEGNDDNSGGPLDAHVDSMTMNSHLVGMCEIINH